MNRMQIMEQLQAFLPAIKRGWWIIALSSLFALTLSLYSSYEETPQYRTSAKVIITPSTLIERDSDLLRAQEGLGDRALATTHVELLKSRSHREQAISLLPASLEEQAEMRSYKVNAVMLPETSVIEVFVEGKTPALTAMLANGVAEQGILVFQQIYVPYNMRFLDTAGVPRSPVSPQPTRDAPLAVFMGFGLGVALLFGYEQVRSFVVYKRGETAVAEEAGDAIVDDEDVVRLGDGMAYRIASGTHGAEQKQPS